MKDGLVYCRALVFVFLMGVTVLTFLAVFTDLYDPGFAFVYYEYVCCLICCVVVFSLPLHADALIRFHAWHRDFSQLSVNEKKIAFNEVAKPIVVDAAGICVMCCIAYVIFQFAWPYIVPPEVVANYQLCYSQPYGCGYVNITNVTILEVMEP